MRRAAIMASARCAPMGVTRARMLKEVDLILATMFASSEPSWQKRLATKSKTWWKGFRMTRRDARRQMDGAKT